MTCRIWIACFISLLAFSPTLRGQVADHTLSVGLKHGTFYAPMKWVPLRVNVRNNSARALDGYVDMPIAGERMAVTLRLPVHVPAHSRVTQTAYAYFPEEVAMTAQEKKRGIVPAVTITELHGAGGDVLAREPLLAQPITPGDQFVFLGPAAPATTLLVADDFSESEAFDASSFMNVLQTAAGYASRLHGISSGDVPRNRAALDSVRTIVLGRVDPDKLDPVQQQTLLRFVRGGGVLVVSCPDPDVIGRSWLAEHLPVHLIGQRLADEIHHENRAISFIEYAPMAEALAGNGEVIAADEHYVHAAFTPMGLGRIVFTSFPINALQPDDEVARRLWTRLLRTDAPNRDWSLSELPAVRDSVLSRIIGKTVAPWGLAAGVTGGYVLLVVGAQLTLGGARRPRAFAATLGIAGLLSLVLIGAGFVRGSQQAPMAARLATLDLSNEGGGVIQESVAFVGKSDDAFALQAASSDVTLRVDQTFTGGDSPVVQQQPFAAPRAAMLSESYQRVWRVESLLPTDLRLSAIGRFEAEGLKLRISNALGTPLEAPHIAWGDTVLNLGAALPAGESNRTPAVDSGTSMLVSGEDKLRQEILNASIKTRTLLPHTNTRQGPPMLLGFIGEAAVPRLLQTSSDDELTVRTQALVRLPLIIEPTPVGQSVRVPHGLVEVQSLRATMGLPYDFNTGEWLPRPHPDTFLVGFAAPWQMGVLKPTRAFIDVSLSAPRHRITLRPRSGGKGVSWDAPVTAYTTTLELSPADADENGILWLTLEVTDLGTPTPGELPTPWHIRWLRMGLEGQIADAPRRPDPSANRLLADDDNAAAKAPAGKSQPAKTASKEPAKAAKKP